VTVDFGSDQSPRVLVFSATEMYAEAPAYSGAPHAESFPAVDITVKNVDDDGVPIPTEEVTSAGAYTFRREELRPPDLALTSPYVRITGEIADKLKREILFETSITTHTDFAPDGATVELAGIPSISVIGPRVIPDAEGEESEPVWEQQIDLSYDRFPAPTMHTFGYDLIVTSNSMIELLTLMGVVRKFFRRNPYLLLTADVPVDQQMRMPMIMTDEPEFRVTPSNSNVRDFSASFEVRRVAILSLPPDLKSWELVDDETKLELQKIGGTLVETVTVV
jgi:hypothetical protein